MWSLESTLKNTFLCFDVDEPRAVRRTRSAPGRVWCGEALPVRRGSQEARKAVYVAPTRPTSKQCSSGVGRRDRGGACARPAAAGASVVPAGASTVMVKGLYFSDSVHSVRKLLSQGGFEGTYDFVFAPVDYDTEFTGCYKSFGFAFVNFNSPHSVETFLASAQGHRRGKKFLTATWAKVQGVEANVRGYWERAEARGMQGHFGAMSRPWVFGRGRAAPVPVPSELEACLTPAQAAVAHEVQRSGKRGIKRGGCSWQWLYSSAVSPDRTGGIHEFERQPSATHNPQPTKPFFCDPWHDAWPAISPSHTSAHHPRILPTTTHH